MNIKVDVVVQPLPVSEVNEGMTADEIAQATGKLTSAEINLLREVGSDQYIEMASNEAGERVLSCIIDDSIVWVVFNFMLDRGQAPEIVLATYQDGTLVPGLPLNIIKRDSFFPSSNPPQFAGWL